MANVGDDQNGKDCLQTLEKNGVMTDLVEVQKGLKTNHNFVLNYGAERTILIKHEPFTYDFAKAIESFKDIPTWIYLSSVSEKTLDYHEQIADYLEKYPEIKLAFQPGTFQMKLGADKLSRLYKLTDIFFCNKEEAQRILTSKEEDVKVLMSSLHALGPKIVCVTDGPNGAYGFDGEKYFFVPMYPDPKPPVSRTGAGDAFSSTVTVMLGLGKSFSEALLYGPVNSMSVVQSIGAQTGLLSREKIEEFLKNAPENYKVKEI
jgi:ribokinase